ncbi:CoA pyrophosphatase [Vibrio sp. SS-MA-C1-2]|uniref:CoA pyrophosphatase n=1 Tax=Vibrio sp. SS-MA-C1-2 TaxID=2908646 RepID=UPI001F21DD7D|nr:CoA pyrophosphatase [Vibrio sp. SS-MA-C1-2]UJF17589.1 CoA pyrophosphatase [Vibrio sp. SS-MA-C1-2]
MNNKNTLLQQFIFSPSTQHPDISIPVNKLRDAAVLIPVTHYQGELALILTQRALHLRHHPGQCSFPGGKFDPQDSNLQHTALRETEEEIGIQPNQINIWGELPNLKTFSGFTIHPFIAYVEPSYQLKINHDEVESVFYLPVKHLFNPRNFIHYNVSFRKQKQTLIIVKHNNYFIWGATAQIIKNLANQLKS